MTQYPTTNSMIEYVTTLPYPGALYIRSIHWDQYYIHDYRMQYDYLEEYKLSRILYKNSIPVIK